MTSARRKATLAVAIVIFLVGFFHAVWSIASIRNSIEEISRQQLLVTRLADLESKVAAIDEARNVLDAVETRIPADMDKLLQSAGLADKVTDSREAISNAGQGWSVLVRELSLNDVVLSDLNGFFAVAQAGRPPWTLTKIVVRSSPFESGRGQVVLTMQSLRGKSQ